MNLIKAAQRGYRGSATLPDGSGTWYSQLGPRSNIDYKAEIGNPMTSALVASCMGYITDQWKQSPDVIFRTEVEGDEPVMERKHRLLELLKNPNEVYGASLFRDGIIQDLKLDGTAFAHVEYDRFGLPIKLWWLPTESVRCEYTPDREWVRYWEYTSGGRSVKFAPEEVLVWREGLDKSTGGRRGFSRFRAAIAEVYGDNEARNTVNIIMRNRAQMGTVITPSERYMAEVVKAKAWDSLGFNKQTADEMEAKVNAKYTGDGRGRLNIFNTPMTVQEFGSVLEHLDSQAIRSLPQSMVASIFGIHPATVSFLIGLQSSQDKNNIQFANRMSWMNGIMPVQDNFAEPINEFLLPLTDLNAANLKFGFDRTAVEALQEDANEKSNRVIAQWEKNAITHDEMRTELGLEIDPALKGMYFKDLQAQAAEHAASLASDTAGAKELLGRKWRQRAES